MRRILKWGQVEKRDNNFYDPSKELNFILPVGDGGRHNGSLSFKWQDDGSLEVGAREDIHAWGNTEFIRIPPDGAELVRKFLEGGQGGYYETPYRETAMVEGLREENAKRSEQS